MFKKLLFVITIGLMLGGGLFSVNPSRASSLPGYYSSYWYHARTVHVKQPVEVAQLKPETQQITSKRVLLQDSKIKVWNSTEWGWVVKSAYLPKKSGYIWVVSGHNSQNWLKW